MDTTERYDSEGMNEHLARVRELHGAGYRLVQIGCLEVARPQPEPKAEDQSTDGHEAAKSLEIIYSFEKAYELTHLRLTVESGEHVPSVSTIYDMAFLYENEIHDLFGVQFDGMSIDFKGTFYQKKMARPFCSTNGTTPVAPKA